MTVWIKWFLFWCWIEGTIKHLDVIELVFFSTTNMERVELAPTFYSHVKYHWLVPTVLALSEENALVHQNERFVQNSRCAQLMQKIIRTGSHEPRRGNWHFCMETKASTDNHQQKVVSFKRFDENLLENTWKSEYQRAISCLIELLIEHDSRTQTNKCGY